MASRRDDFDRNNRFFSDSGSHDRRDRFSNMNRRGPSQWSRNTRDFHRHFDDYEGRSPRNDNYQFDRDPGSFETRRRDQDFDFDPNRSWQDSQYGYGSANQRGSYQGHGIDMDSSRNSGSRSDNPRNEESWGSTTDWAHQSGRQSYGSGYGAYQGSSHGSYQEPREPSSWASSTWSPQHQNVNPGFQEFSRESFRNDHVPWSPQGTFAGRGPKGYRRSDERIKDDVCYALMMAPQVDASQIEVDVKDGAVFLTGSVDDRKMKRMAEDCIEHVQGVTDVHNQLKVQSSLLGAIGAALTGQTSDSKRDESFRPTKTAEKTNMSPSSSSSSRDSDFTQDSKSRSNQQRS